MLNLELTDLDIEKQNEIVAKALSDSKQKAEEIRAEWSTAKGKELKSKGLTPAKIKKVIEGRTVAHGEGNNLYFLSPDDEIKTHEGLFKVSEIIADPTRFHKMECVDIDDVDDPKDCDRYRAIIRFGDDESVTIYSQASGGKMYILLRRKAQPPKDLIPLHLPIPNFKELAPDKKVTKLGVTIKPTLTNLKLLSKLYGVNFSQDVMKRQNRIHYPNATDRGNLSNEADVYKLMDLCLLNDINERVVDKRGVIFDENRVNPVVDMFKLKKWDGHDRFDDLVKTVTLAYENDISYFKGILRMWLLQCVAAADYVENSPLTAQGIALPVFSSVLVFTGGQGASKTEWLMNLTPKNLVGYTAKGVCLRIDDKDSIFQATSYWIVEWGELGATFRRSDLDQVKAFLSHSVDIMRRPYGIETCEFARRTSFCATVNDTKFLHDTTGNRRFLPIEVTKCDKNHSVDMQQLWAQMWEEYLNGARWWFEASDELSKEVLAKQRAAMDYDPIIEKFVRVFGEFDLTKNANCAMTMAEILFEILPTTKFEGIKKLEREPSKVERSKLRHFLIERGVVNTTVKGVDKYKFFNKLLPTVRETSAAEIAEIDKIWG